MSIYFGYQTYDIAFHLSLDVVVKGWPIVFFGNQLLRLIDSEDRLPKDYYSIGPLIRFIPIAILILSKFLVDKSQ